MTSDAALGLMAETLRLGLLLSLPLLGVILVVGLLISVLQDPSIAFVPKVILFAVVLALLAPWILGKLTGFGVAMFARLAQ